MKDGTYVSPREVFASFERRYAGGFDPPMLARELTTYAGYYRVIRGIEPASSTLQGPLQKLLRLDSSTTYPLLLNLYSRAQSGGMAHDGLAGAVDRLAGFIPRRLICQESSRQYGRWFVSACNQLGDDPARGLELFLEERGFPADERFKAAFLTRDLYHSAYAHAILLGLELALPHKEPADLSKTTVEHIMPQTLAHAWREDLGADALAVHAELLHTAGNLTLSAYNPELRNSRFALKRNYYKKSNVGMNKEIATNEVWTREQIVRRDEELADLASTVWPGPAEETEPALPPGDADQINLYAEYWAAFSALLGETGSPLIPMATVDKDRLDVDIGAENSTLQAFVSGGRSRGVGIILSLAGPNRYETYRALLRNKKEIEAEIGRGLYWSGRPKEADSQISTYMTHPNPNDRKQWSQQHEWLRENIERMTVSLGQRIQGIEESDEAAAELAEKA